MLLQNGPSSLSGRSKSRKYCSRSLPCATLFKTAVRIRHARPEQGNYVLCQALDTMSSWRHFWSSATGLQVSHCFWRGCALQRRHWMALRTDGATSWSS